jgi:TetR/AcrR family transcriptional repressor of nem operon
VARPREFSESEALDAAVSRFWEHGYEASSVRELADAMGINGASLYNTFGDKRALYRRALDRYVEQSLGERVARLEGDLPPRQAIEAYFGEIVGRSLEDGRRRGCMLVNSALELAPHDAEFREIVGGVLKRVEAFFRRSVEAGQRDGSIRSSQPAEDLARLLLSAQLGIRVLARSRPEPALLQGVVRSALAALDSG